MHMQGIIAANKLYNSFSLSHFHFFYSFQSCSRILLVEEERVGYLKKMRNPKLDHLRKNETFKKVVKRCTAMASSKKAVICSRCGYINGSFLTCYFHR